jgi:ribonuclease P protein component
MKNGRVIHSPFFLARIAKGKPDEPARLAAVAPVKIAKTSVARHKIRRRMYEAARPFMQKALPGNTVILFAKQPIVSAEFADLRRATEDIFVKAGLLR